MKDRVKRAVFFVLMVVLIWGVIEIAAVIGHGLRYGRMYSPSRIEQLALAAAAESAVAAVTAVRGAGKAMSPRWIEVIHPYFGVAVDPRRDPTGSVNDFGFVSDPSAGLLARSSPGSRRIAIFGGSFAAGLYYQARPLLREQPESTGQTVETINFSKGGYKQPQQLLILSYMLSLGLELDIVINVDGFNEVAIPPVENVPRGVYPFYPRQWHRRARGVIDPESVRQIGYLEVLGERKSQRAVQFLEHNLQHSAVASLVWRYLDQGSDRELYAARQRIDRRNAEEASLRLNRSSWTCLRKQGVADATVESLRPLERRLFYDRPALHEAVEARIGAAPAAEHREPIAACAIEVAAAYAAFGPRYDATEDELYDDLVATWERSSLQMKALCDASGIRYLHFLQPNQYVLGSKVMSEDEQRIALRTDQQYRPGAERGYPLLREAGRRLLAQGVEFTDLTMVFQDIQEPVYADDCCHLNALGSEIVMSEIAATIATASGRAK